MKKLIVPILVVAFFLVNTGTVAADGNYTRLVIPKLGISVAIQPSHQSPDGSWEEPNHVGAWCLVPESYPARKCLQAIFAHRSDHGSGFPSLVEGDLVFIYEDDWGLDRVPLQLRVLEVRNPVVPKGAEDWVPGVVGGDIFALITCHPAGDSEAPERYVVWLRIDHGPLWAPVFWGDSLTGIAERYGVAAAKIANANGITKPNLIRAGTLLLIPGK